MGCHGQGQPAYNAGMSQPPLIPSRPDRVLVVGAHGQLGQALVARLGDRCVAALDRTDLDLADLESLADRLHDLLQAWQPSVIINAAAYTAVDQAESEAATAYDVNALAPGILASVAAACRIALVHYSTDYVFDGQASHPYRETDAPQPLSVYGRSKLAGERAVQAARGRSLILRTSWVFGEQGSNFLKTMLRLAQERDTLRVVSDQVGAPTSARLIAEMTLQALTQLSDSVDPNDDRWGLYHVCAAGEVSWHGYASFLIESARQRGWPIRLAPEALLAIPSQAYPTAAQRPASSRLCTDKFRQAFGVVLPDWREGVVQVLDALQARS